MLKEHIGAAVLSFEREKRMAEIIRRKTKSLLHESGDFPEDPVNGDLLDR
jgi:hypothetical protein